MKRYDPTKPLPTDYLPKEPIVKRFKDEGTLTDAAMKAAAAGRAIVDEETGEVLAEPATIFWKTPYNHDTMKESDRTALTCNDVSLTKQEFVEESDMNVIIDRLLRGADAPPPVLPEHFGDMTTKTSYFDMQTKLAEANETFYGLPAKKREEFGNNAAVWADAVVTALNAGNRDALVAMGLDIPDPNLKRTQGEGQESAPRGAPATPVAADNKEPPSGSTKPPTEAKG